MKQSLINHHYKNMMKSLYIGDRQNAEFLKDTQLVKMLAFVKLKID